MKPGPGQWKRIYKTGAELAFAMNILYIILAYLPSLTTGEPEAVASVIEAFIVAIINSVMPLAAVILETPVQGIISGAAYVFVGLFYWTGKYELSRRKRGV